MYDKKLFLNNGKNVESLFAELLGGEIAYSSKSQDINEHWDVALFTPNGIIKYDIKANSTAKFQENRANKQLVQGFWIELKNVQGEIGWLYGEADKFVFYTETHFIIVDKSILQSFIADKCKTKKKTRNKNVFYHLYQRRGRKDLIVKVKEIDLLLHSELILDLKGNKYKLNKIK